MNQENPFAPPAVIDSGKQPGNLWQVTHVSVLVKNGAILPPVELETGDDGPDLVPAKSTFIKASWVNALGGFAWIPFIFMLQNHAGTPWISPFVPMLVVGLGTVIVSKFTTRQIRFQIHRNAREERRRKRRRRINAMIGTISILLLISPALLIASDDSWFTAYSDLMPFLFLAGLAGLLATVIGNHVFRPKIRMIAADDDWVRLTDVHPVALRKLRAIARASNGNGPENSGPSHGWNFGSVRLTRRSK